MQTVCTDFTSVFLTHVAQSLAQWLFGVPKTDRPPKARQRHRTVSKKHIACSGCAHSFLKFDRASRWTCIGCCLEVDTLSDPRVRHTSCARSVKNFFRLAACDGAHKMWVGRFIDSGSFIFFCSRCGAWATSKPKLLLEHCRGFVQSSRSTDHKRLLQCQHLNKCIESLRRCSDLCDLRR